MANKDLNRHTCTGRLTADPELRYMPNQEAVCSVRIAMNDSYKDKTTGQMVDKAEYITYKACGKLGEICGTYLKKGAEVYLEGKLETRKWDDKQGVTHYTTEIRMENMKMLGRREEGTPRQNAPGGSRPRNQAPAQNTGSAWPDDEPPVY